MKRYSETVLNGHPDKFCDLIADRIIRQAYKTDNEAYAQIEVSVWSDQIFFTGAVATKQKCEIDLKKIVTETGNEIGYTKENHIDASRYKILDLICRLTEPPQKWTNFVNDQSVVIGYAGYDAKTRFLPPEHFAAWYFREQVTRQLNETLEGHGPDGKILVITEENSNDWRIRKILMTLQQKEKYPFTDFTFECSCVLKNAFLKLKEHDKRWTGEWKEIEVMINPNGPLFNGGSDGDNGQTGRKLVMDYYGPRIPLGGGALYGKDLSHIDRLGSYSARKFALELVSKGSSEALVSVCYAPGVNTPININISSEVKPHTDPYDYFKFSEMHKQINCVDLQYDIYTLGTFYNPELSFNCVNYN